MTTQTKTRKMPASYYVGAPQIVRDKVAYIVKLPEPHAAGMTYEILLVEQDADGNTVGLDLGPLREGQHFFLSSIEAQNYKRTCGKRKTRWSALPGVMQQTITNYLKHT